jgi:hypothetical protein
MSWPVTYYRLRDSREPVTEFVDSLPGSSADLADRIFGGSGLARG